MYGSSFANMDFFRSNDLYHSRFPGFYSQINRDTQNYAQHSADRSGRIVFRKSKQFGRSSERLGSYKNTFQRRNVGFKRNHQRQLKHPKQIPEAWSISPNWIRDDAPVFTRSNGTFLAFKTNALYERDTYSNPKHPTANFPSQRIGGNIYLSTKQKSKKVTKEELDKELEEYMIAAQFKHPTATFPSQKNSGRNANVHRYGKRKSRKLTKEALDEELEEYMYGVHYKYSATDPHTRWDSKKITKEQLDDELEEYMTEVLLYPKRSRNVFM